jgi:microcystin-dependent protein
MSEPFLGEIRMFAGNFAIQGWAFCDGALLPIYANNALFSVIGTIYGGDGMSTFALPDLRGRVPVHKGTNPTTGTTYTIGRKGGSETETMTTNQMPAHSHVPRGDHNSGTVTTPAGNVWAAATSARQFASTPGAAMNNQAIGPVGGGQPHENMLPFTVISFIISLSGDYPYRD